MRRRLIGLAASLLIALPAIADAQTTTDTPRDPIGDLINPDAVPDGPSAEVPTPAGSPPAEQLPYE